MVREALVSMTSSALSEYLMDECRKVVAKANPEEAEAKEAADEEERKASALAEVNSAKDASVLSAEKPSNEVELKKATEKSQVDGIMSVEVVEGDEDLPEAMKTINSSKKLLSEHLHSVGGTSKSIGRSTKFFQRVQEINEKQKITKWEDMLSEYYSESM